MKPFKKFITLLAAGMLFSANAEDTIKIGVEGAYPPFSEISKSGEVIGFDVDIANALCKQMNRKCELIQIDWDGLIPAIKSHKIDAIIASMSATPEREKQIAFSDRYYKIPVRVIRKKGSNIEYGVDGFKGKTIGVQRSTTFDHQITSDFGKIATIKRYGSNDEAYLDLQAGRVDVVAAESLALKDGFLDKPAGKDYEFFGPKLVDPKFYGKGIAIGLNKDNPELKKHLIKLSKISVQMVFINRSMTNTLTLMFMENN